ncbi:MAG: CAP domain-containing protein [Aestuariivirgaceae bacterium]|nr:CAP domain-containing protein [Aestuariivirgaceae bacterium]
MMRLAVLLLSVFVLLSGPGFAASNYKAYGEQLNSHLPKGVKIRPDMEAELNRLVNAARQAKGRPALKPSPLFTVMARTQAIDMVLTDKVWHSSARGEGFPTRFAAFANGVKYTMNGENAARDRQPGPVDNKKAARLFEQWMNSSGHYRALMNAGYLHVSTGAVQKGNHLYAIQIFWAEPLKCNGICATSSVFKIE